MTGRTSKCVPICVSRYIHIPELFGDADEYILGGFQDMTGFVQFGEEFRQHRRLMQRVLGTRSSTAPFLPLVEVQTHRLLKRILDKPESIVAHLRRYASHSLAVVHLCLRSHSTAGAIILKITYGHDVRENDDPLVELVDRTMDIFSQTSQPGTYLVDLVPICEFARVATYE